MEHVKMSLTRGIQCCPNFLDVFDSTTPPVRSEGVGFGVETDSEGTTFQVGLRSQEDNPASEVRLFCKVGHSGPEGPRRLRLPDFKTIGT
jgi:hypothetical protein